MKHHDMRDAHDYDQRSNHDDGVADDDDDDDDRH